MVFSLVRFVTVVSLVILASVASAETFDMEIHKSTRYPKFDSTCHYLGDVLLQLPPQRKSVDVYFDSNGLKFDARDLVGPTCAGMKGLPGGVQPPLGGRLEVELIVPELTGLNSAKLMIEASEVNGQPFLKQTCQFDYKCAPGPLGEDTVVAFPVPKPAPSETCDVVCDCYLSGAEGYQIDQIQVKEWAYCPADSAKLSSLYKFLVEKNYEECSRSWPRSAGSRRFGACTKNF